MRTPLQTMKILTSAIVKIEDSIFKTRQNYDYLFNNTLNDLSF